MRQHRINIMVVVGAIAVIILSVPSLVIAQVDLTGSQEVPVISTTGEGEFRAQINEDGTVDYELRYDLEGEVTQAHIHFGQRGVNGGIIVFLCTNVGGPAGTPPCPPSPGRVRGTLEASDIIGPENQGIEPGNIEEVLEAVFAGQTYVNVHSDLFPGGEIRGQIELE